MIVSLKSNIDLKKLLAEVKRLAFWEDGSKALMAFKQSCHIHDVVIKGALKSSPILESALEEISKLRQCPALFLMVNVVPPGVIIPQHTDTLIAHPVHGDRPRLERWHLPIITNDKCQWWDEVNQDIPMKQGYWHGPMPYWNKHDVRNGGTTERIHLVVDLDLEYDEKSISEWKEELDKKELENKKQLELASEKLKKRQQEELVASQPKEESLMKQPIEQAVGHLLNLDDKTNHGTAKS